MTKITAAITAVGKYLPEYVLSNEILETMVETMMNGLFLEQVLKSVEY